MKPGRRRKNANHLQHLQKADEEKKIKKKLRKKINEINKINKKKDIQGDLFSPRWRWLVLWSSECNDFSFPVTVRIWECWGRGYECGRYGLDLEKDTLDELLMVFSMYVVAT